jgi:hypothetical protein
MAETFISSVQIEINEKLKELSVNEITTITLNTDVLKHNFEIVIDILKKLSVKTEHNTGDIHDSKSEVKDLTERLEKLEKKQNRDNNDTNQKIQDTNSNLNNVKDKTDQNTHDIEKILNQLKDMRDSQNDLKNSNNDCKEFKFCSNQYSAKRDQAPQGESR